MYLMFNFGNSRSFPLTYFHIWVNENVYITFVSTIHCICNYILAIKFATTANLDHSAIRKRIKQITTNRNISVVIRTLGTRYLCPTCCD